MELAWQQEGSLLGTQWQTALGGPLLFLRTIVPARVRPNQKPPQPHHQANRMPPPLPATPAGWTVADSKAEGNGTEAPGSPSAGRPPNTVAVARQLSAGWLHDQPIGAGLANLGNSCFLNSLLQALAYLPPLGNLCLARAHRRACTLGPNCVFCKLEEQLARLLSRPPAGAGCADAPDALHRALPLIGRAFVRGRQEDAHELLRCLVEALERDLLRLDGRWRPGGRRLACPGTVVNVLFQGSVLNQVRCLACGHESNTWDPIQVGEGVCGWCGRRGCWARLRGVCGGGGGCGQQQQPGTICLSPLVF